jgi:hypothetical protein
LVPALSMDHRVKPGGDEVRNAAPIHISFIAAPRA